MESRKLKIISLGTGQINFLSELYANIAKTLGHAVGFRLTEEKKFSADVDYSGDHLISHVAPKQQNSPKSLFYLLINLILRPKLFVSYLNLKDEFNMQRWSGKNIFSALKDVLNNRLEQNAKFKDDQWDGDLYHVHFIVRNNLNDLWFVPKDKPVVVSFWGSDLMRYTGEQQSFYQKAALGRANVITVHSEEMKTMVLEKFGAHFAPKIELALFSLTNKLFDLIDEQQNTPSTKFTRPYGPTMVIGHNGSKYNQHIEIIEALEKKCALQLYPNFIILPFSYCPDGEAYKEKVKTKIDGIENVLMIEDFLSWEDLADLRNSTSIYIHLPISDAMSGALTESIYAGAKAIVGEWLPYSRYDEFKIPLTRIASIEDLTEVIDTEKNGLKADNVKDKIRRNLIGESTAKTWVSIYKKLINI